MGHQPAGASFKQFAHYIQILRSHRFAQYDYGERLNLMYYGSEVPPEYPLKQIKTPIALYYCTQDQFAPKEDVKNLKKLLPNVVKFVAMLQNYTHISVVVRRSAREILYVPMVQEMKKFV